MDSRDGESHPLEARMEGAKKLLDETKMQKGETICAGLDVFSKRREMYAVLQVRRPAVPDHIRWVCACDGALGMSEHHHSGRLSASTANCKVLSASHAVVVPA